MGRLTKAAISLDIALNAKRVSRETGLILTAIGALKEEIEALREAVEAVTNERE